MKDSERDLRDTEIFPEFLRVLVTEIRGCDTKNYGVHVVKHNHHGLFYDLI